MVDITFIDSALTAIKTSSDLASLIRKSSSSLSEAETKLKIADLISNLAEAKIQITMVNEFLSEKDKEISELKEQLTLSETITFKEPYYYLSNKNEMDGPFCQLCFDDHKKLIRLQKHKVKPDYRICNKCHT